MEIEPKIQEKAQGQLEAKENKRKQTIAEIRQQLSFYLSDVNYTTDSYFRKLAEKDKGWIPVSAFLKCHKIQYILTKNFPEMSRRSKQRIMRMTVKNNSQFNVKPDCQKIKKKRKFVEHKHQKNVLYFQLTKTLPKSVLERVISDAFQKIKASENSVNMSINFQLKINQNSLWGFIYSLHVHLLKNWLIESSLQFQGQNLSIKVREYQEWKAYKQSYNRIFRDLYQRKNDTKK